MTTQIFDSETGLLLLDEWVAKCNSFQRIMQDEVVTDEEIAQQSTMVLALFQRLEETLNEESKSLVMSAIAEMAVLQVVTQIKQLQEIKNIGSYGNI